MSSEVLKLQLICGRVARMSELEEYQETIKSWNLKKLKNEYAKLEQYISEFVALGAGFNDEFLKEVNKKMDLIHLEIKRR